MEESQKQTILSVIIIILLAGIFLVLLYNNGLLDKYVGMKDDYNEVYQANNNQPQTVQQRLPNAEEVLRQKAGRPSDVLRKQTLVNQYPNYKFDEIKLYGFDVEQTPDSNLRFMAIPLFVHIVTCSFYYKKTD
ncbi:MAG: hypothetical protein K0R71_365 [Bacillales bacterium]|jgi:hypothetical protein|nr:hypothetical protein [Bacillales bacterium]